MKKTIGIIMVVLSTSIFAQDTPQTKVDQPVTRVERVTVQVSASRQLTGEQQSEFYSIVQSFKQKQSLVELDIREVNLKIQKEMLQDSPSLKTINNLIDKKAKLVAQLEKNVFEANFKINSIL